MKVRIFREHLDRVDVLSDNEKVFMGLLTFLHRKYRETHIFKIYPNDIRTILDQEATGALYINTSVFVRARFGHKAVFYGLGKIHNLDDTVLIDIKEPAACTVQGYLIGLYKHKQEWQDVQQHKLAWNQRRDFAFTHNERDTYFKSPENRYNDEHGFKRTKERDSRDEV